MLSTDLLLGGSEKKIQGLACTFAKSDIRQLQASLYTAACASCYLRIDGAYSAQMFKRSRAEVRCTMLFAPHGTCLICETLLRPSAAFYCSSCCCSVATHAADSSSVMAHNTLPGVAQAHAARQGASRAFQLRQPSSVASVQHAAAV